MKIKLLIASIISYVVLVVAGLGSVAYAADPLNPICRSGGGSSTACQSRTTSNPIFGPTGILTRVVQILVMITAIIAVIMIMVGGFKYIISTGDSGKINNAKDTILYAIIGLVVAVLGQAIVSFVLQKL